MELQGTTGDRVVGRLHALSEAMIEGGGHSQNHRFAKGLMVANAVADPRRTPVMAAILGRR